MAKTAKRPAKRKSARAPAARKRTVVAKRATKIRARASTKTKPAPRKPARRPQRFTASHARDANFDHGLRAYAAYRDLGIAAATDGLVQAHVIRFKPPFRPEEASTPHYHDVEFQMVYVLKGWYQTEFEGEGVHTFEAGSCWIQPPKIRHAVRGYSDDCELLEIVLPADFATETVDSVD